MKYLVLLPAVAFVVVWRLLPHDADAYWRRLFYAQSYAAPAFAVTMLVTGFGPLALFAGMVTTVFATRDWDSHHSLGGNR